jgi:hypothetical protein
LRYRKDRRENWAMLQAREARARSMPFRVPIEKDAFGGAVEIVVLPRPETPYEGTQSDRS